MYEKLLVLDRDNEPIGGKAYEVSSDLEKGFHHARCVFPVHFSATYLILASQSLQPDDLTLSIRDAFHFISAFMVPI